MRVAHRSRHTNFKIRDDPKPTGLTMFIFDESPPSCQAGFLSLAQINQAVNKGGGWHEELNKGKIPPDII